MKKNVKKNVRKKGLTADDVWAMFAEVRLMQQETDRIMKENALERKERDKQADERMKKLDERIGYVGEKLGGVSNNIGHHAEQFFQDVFKRKLEFGKVKYDEMVSNLTYIDKGVKIEFDIALLNGDSIALIEVKNRIHPDFVDALAEERIENFRKFFPRYKDYRAYLGIAGFSFSDEVLDRAGRYGIGIVKQVGEGIEIKADNLRAY